MADVLVQLRESDVKGTILPLSVEMVEVTCQSQDRMTNSVHPDEVVLYEPSQLVLHCLHWYLVCSAGIERVNSCYPTVPLFLYIFKYNNSVPYLT